MIQSRVNFLKKEKKGATLIDQDTKQWNMELINVVFSCNEANLISRIPLHQYGSATNLFGEAQPIEYSWLYVHTTCKGNPR